MSNSDRKLKKSSKGIDNLYCTQYNIIRKRKEKPVGQEVINMTREDIMKAIENMESIDSREIEGRRYDLYTIDDDGTEISVVDSDEIDKERITLTPKDGTMILKSLDGVEDVELMDVSEVYGF